MKALHFGAGKIGRGFIGALVVKAGYELLFADVDLGLVEALNARGGYRVHIAESEPEYEDILGVEAAVISSPRVVERVAAANLITTAVSMGALRAVAPTVAQGLRARMAAGNSAPLNIICCENGIRATSQFKAMVYSLLDEDVQQWCERYVGFADSAVDRIVPNISLAAGLDVAVERYFEWCIDSRAIVGTLPPIAGVKYTDNLDACIERKLFTLNTAHCATAYLGALRGYKYIHEAIGDKWVRSVVLRIMEQSSEALIAKFGLVRTEQQRYISTILQRFGNSALGDTVARVARDPMRKLSPALYFAYPAAMAIGYGLDTDALQMAVAAAMRYRSAEDSQSVELQQLIARQGVLSTAEQLTGITHPPFLEGVESFYGKLQ
ncbi:MAG: mannitol-1-phosphate 5-dehydrogenase [Alistipes sp.]|nr:mannitol-1-phosphate 5-dehydrogenase [Alistipes sp.]